jgi:3-hydroxyisobutyrate dehydrogenase-like beta-hydroxyacid dehydrogenase
MPKISKTKIGLLHPGEMGVSIGASAQNSDCQVIWASHGRSLVTRARANSQGFEDAGSLADLCQTCKVIISVCPPHFAASLAQEVIEFGFQGLYIDANAISPDHVLKIERSMCSHGILFVDGGIIGGPAWKPGETVLYLSGQDADLAANLFKNGPLATKILGEHVGMASALKLCYASYTKGITALLCASLAAAEQFGVRKAYQEQWVLENNELAVNAEKRLRGVTLKAWRFSGEMNEIAEMFAAAGLPVGFHQASGEIFERMAKYKDADPLPTAQEILESLLNRESLNE